jgi:hypothetical protein
MQEEKFMDSWLPHKKIVFGFCRVSYKSSRKAAKTQRKIPRESLVSLKLCVRQKESYVYRSRET